MAAGTLREKGGTIKRGSAQHRLVLIERKREISELYLQGWVQDDIADKLGISAAQVCQDLKKIREAWQEKVLLNFEERKMVELARIDQLELWATDAWHKSCADAETKTIKVEKAMQVVKKDAGSAGKGSKDRGKKGMVGSAVPEVKMVPVRRYVEEQRKGQTGNPAFLDRIAWCIETRMRIFGVLEQKHNQVNVLSINWDGLASKPRAAQDDVEEKLLLLEQRAAQVEEAEVVNVDKGERNGTH